MSITPSPPQMGETDKWSCAVCGHDQKLHAWDIVSAGDGLAVAGCQVQGCRCDGFEDEE